MTIHTEMWRSNADRTSVQVALTNRVWQELRTEPATDIAALRAEVDDFIAVLDGTVPTLPARVAAERAARRVPGIQAVVNHIVVALRPDDERSDAELGSAAALALSWDVRVPPGVRATVRRGWVTLEGEVSAEYQREAAEETVGRLVGARGLTSEIAIEPLTRPADLRARVRDALAHDPRLAPRHIRVDAIEDAIVLQGRVRSLAERDEAEQVAWSVAGVGRLKDALQVRRS